MISINRMNAEQLIEYIGHLIVAGKKSAFTNVDLIEIKNYFRMWQNDAFLMVKCTGNISDLGNELSYIKFPGKSFGKLLIISGGKSLTINNVMDLQSKFLQEFSTEERCPLLTWFLDDESQEAEMVLISKIYDAMNIFTENNFGSLWDAIIEEMDATNDKGCFDSLRNVDCYIEGNVLKLKTNGDSRNHFMISLKKQDIEKSVYEFTGKRLFVEII